MMSTEIEGISLTERVNSQFIDDTTCLCDPGVESLEIPT
jgi:hypothetical protein